MASKVDTSCLVVSHVVRANRACCILHAAVVRTTQVLQHAAAFLRPLSHQCCIQTPILSHFTIPVCFSLYLYKEWKNPMKGV